MGHIFYNLFRPQRLFFEVSDAPGTISLTDALAGDTGTVCLGNEGVSLWTPSVDLSEMNAEMVCDARYAAMSEALYKKFAEAAEGRFLPAHVVIFQGKDPEKIALALKYFDYVLVPDPRIKNLPVDMRRRVLSYREI